MVKSMTGFGRFEIEENNRRFTVDSASPKSSLASLLPILPCSDTYSRINFSLSAFYRLFLEILDESVS